MPMAVAAPDSSIDRTASAERPAPSHPDIRFSRFPPCTLRRPRYNDPRRPTQRHRKQSGEGSNAAYLQTPRPILPRKRGSLPWQTFSASASSVPAASPTFTPMAGTRIPIRPSSPPTAMWRPIAPRAERQVHRWQGQGLRLDRRAGCRSRHRRLRYLPSASPAHPGHPRRREGWQGHPLREAADHVPR